VQIDVHKGVPVFGWPEIVEWACTVGCMPIFVDGKFLYDGNHIDLIFHGYCSIILSLTPETAKKSQRP
jgi:hypothetical protein